MWTPEHRQAAARRGLRYPSDLTDAEWALIEPMIPPARRGGRPRDVNVREVLNGIFYVLWTGCQWSALPKDLPPKSTAHHYFMLWDWDGTLERIHHALYVAVRDREGREASPSAAVIDSQSAKGAQKGGLRSTRRASMRARRSRGASATSSRYTRPVVERHRPSRRRAGSRRRPRAASNRAPFVPLHPPTAATRGRGWRRPSPRPAAGSWTLSAPTRTASWPCRNAGSWSERSPGSAATGASPATSSVMPEPLSPSSVSP